MADEDIATGSSGAHHQVDDRQRPEDVVVEPEEKDSGIFFVKYKEGGGGGGALVDVRPYNFFIFGQYPVPHESTEKEICNVKKAPY